MFGKVYTVSQINRYIKGIFENDVILESICVEAEISNFKAHSSGHLYFTLKDEGSIMNAVMFKSSADRLKFMPKNGMKVIVFGYVSVYEKTGQYQFYAEIMEASGRGDLYLAFEKLKERLDRVGLFDEKHKKPIPKFPKCIAVITSPTGAAIRDILRIAERRNPNVKMVVVPTLVQGENAKDDIVRAIQEVNEWGKADVIIVGRGGGSIEDLWAFNEEKVARAIFESKVPIISAVGHETDFTISDFIADLRASTPSAAVELAIPEMSGLNEKFITIYNRLNSAIDRKIEKNKIRVLNVSSNSSFIRFPKRIREFQIYNDDLTDRLNKDFDYKFITAKNKLIALNDKLEAISPVNILKKGYSLTYNKEGNLIKDSNDIAKGEIINIRLNSGKIKAEVTEKE